MAMVDLCLLSPTSYIKLILIIISISFIKTFREALNVVCPVPKMSANGKRVVL